MTRKYHYILLIAIVAFVVTLALPVILPALGIIIIDTAISITTLVESVMVFFGAFAGVIAMKFVCKKARD